MVAFVVVGHSHLTAVAEAYRNDPTVSANTYKFVQLRDRNFQEAASAGQLVADILEEVGTSDCDLLVSMIGGNEHSVFGLLNHRRKFDFILPGEAKLALQHGAEVLPFSIVKRRLEERISKSVRLPAIAALRNATSIAMCHVECPPPIPSGAYSKASQRVRAADRRARRCAGRTALQVVAGQFVDLSVGLRRSRHRLRAGALRHDRRERDDGARGLEPRPDPRQRIIRAARPNGNRSPRAGLARPRPHAIV